VTSPIWTTCLTTLYVGQLLDKRQPRHSRVVNLEESVDPAVLPHRRRAGRCRLIVAIPPGVHIYLAIGLTDMRKDSTACRRWRGMCRSRIRSRSRRLRLTLVQQRD